MQKAAGCRKTAAIKKLQCHTATTRAHVHKGERFFRRRRGSEQKRFLFRLLRDRERPCARASARRQKRPPPTHTQIDVTQSLHFDLFQLCPSGTGKILVHRAELRTVTHLLVDFSHACFWPPSLMRGEEEEEGESRVVVVPERKRG